MPIQKEIYRSATQSTSRAWRNRFDRYALVGSKCVDCGSEYYPKRKACPKCHSLNLVDKQFSRTGVIEAVSVDYLALMGSIERVPSIKCIVRMGDGPCAYSEVVDCEDPDQVQPGSKVEMVVRRIKRETNGNLQYAHKWRLL